MKHLAIVMLVASLSACATSKTIVEAPKGTKVSKVCIRENPDVAQAGFLPELVSQIEARGVTTVTFANDVPEDCPVRMTYTANWQWDLALFLAFADFALTDNGKPIGRVTYSATQWTSDKFGPTAKKIEPLIAQLFP